MLLLSISLAVAGEPPCYGIPEGHTTLEGEHFWVSWPDELLGEEAADRVLRWAEEARVLYLDMGFAFTDEVVLIEATSGAVSAGFAQTRTCGDLEVPRIQVDVPQNGNPPRNTVVHEVAHAAQYADMGHYLDSVASWVWWMEGSAVWMAYQVDGDADAWGYDAANYLENSHLMLHGNVISYATSDRRLHMYGTAWLASYIEEQHGADAVRDIWAWGGERSGEVIDFREAVEANIGPFEPFWADYLAHSTTGDLENGSALWRRVKAERVPTLPAAGEVERPPEGYGFGVVHFPEGVEGADLSVRVELDPEVDWVVVLAHTNGGLPGRALLDYVVLDVQDGLAEGRLSGFEPGTHAWLVASPLVFDSSPHPFGFEAEVVGLEDPEAPAACGCRTSSGSVWALPLLVVGLLRRRSA